MLRYQVNARNRAESTEKSRIPPPPVEVCLVGPQRAGQVFEWAITQSNLKINRQNANPNLFLRFGKSHVVTLTVIGECVNHMCTLQMPQLIQFSADYKKFKDTESLLTYLWQPQSHHYDPMTRQARAKAKARNQIHCNPWQLEGAGGKEMKWSGQKKRGGYCAQITPFFAQIHSNLTQKPPLFAQMPS